MSAKVCMRQAVRQGGDVGSNIPYTGGITQRDLDGRALAAPSGPGAPQS